MRTLQGLGIFALFFALLSLALLVFVNNPRAQVNRRFSLASLAIAGWILSIYLALSSQDQPTTIWLGRLGFAFASLIPYTLLSMFQAFSDPLRTRRDFLSLLPGLFCVSFACISFTPWIVAGSITTGDKTNFLYGPLHKPFGLYFLACFLLALFTLTRTLSSSSGLRRLQLFYLLIGIFLGGIGAITTNLLIPLITNTSTYSWLGPYFSLLVVSFSAHAIIRHRLMNIKLVIRRGIVYLVASGIAAGVFVAILATLAGLIGQRRQDLPFATQVMVALAVALAFQPLKALIQGSLDRYLYREHYNYQQIIRKASRTIGSTLELDALLTYVSEVVKNTCRPDLVAIFVRDPEDLRFHLAKRTSFGDAGTGELSNTIESTGVLTRFLEESRSPLFRDELEHRLGTPDASEATRELSSLGGQVVLPMFSERQLVGFILLGPKLSGDAYFNEDVELLSTLANQAAIAIKNAQLYRQVVVVNEYIENILRTMDSGVVAIDALGKVALSNSTAERLIGISQDLLKRLSVEGLPRALAVQLKASLLDGQPRLQTEAALAGPSDQRTHLVCSSSALKDGSGAVIGAVIVFSDVSAVKALANEKQRAERLASLGTLVAGIAHEIKNPLVAIKTFAELLPERFSDSDFRGDFTNVVIGEIERIDGLVGRLRGLVAPSPAMAPPVDVRIAITETLVLLRAQCEQTHTTVSRDIDTAPLLISVDVAQLKQLFLNLFLNAIEAMGHDGELIVNAHRRLRQGKTWVTIEILDSGPGIPDSVRPKIFEPFFTTKSQGSGLGLAICQSIADAHQGTIRAENSPGRGATLIVEFPAVEEVSSYSGGISVLRKG
jgi:signal transduction histidine kinase